MLQNTFLVNLTKPTASSVKYHTVIQVICNSTWTEWSTIQGVIAQVISKSDEHDYSLNCTTRGPITN